MKKSLKSKVTVSVTGEGAGPSRELSDRRTALVSQAKEETTATDRKTAGYEKDLSRIKELSEVKKEKKSSEETVSETTGVKNKETDTDMTMEDMEQIFRRSSRLSRSPPEARQSISCTEDCYSLPESNNGSTKRWNRLLRKLRIKISWIGV
ncbi:hypothetical protein WA026_004302 [Henosepilachna vigintioctopunctata]|uniref:Uncharacterized protein n=1 Tax=Henosepilachna vigintioctopunctata TaxID=420089 RepID=A0AAW1V2Y1_9CUCU